jgi:hypothetical protein
MHRRHSVRALAAAALSALAVAAGSVHAQALPQPLVDAHHGPRLKEVGSGKLKWFGLHVYDARLWAQDGSFAFEQSFALALRYARDFKGYKIAETSAEEIARLGFGSAADRERWAAQMKRIFPNVAAGHELVGVNLPGKGVRFYHDDRPIGEIDDPAFARAFFSIWLDPRTRAGDLRAALLGQKR